MPEDAPKTVLVVDDDAEAREIAEISFRAEGIAVVTAASAEEAISILQTREDIGAMLTDVKMPGIDGIELASKAKESDGELSVFVMSGHDDELRRARASNDVADTISKPVDISRILRKIKRALQ